VGSASETVASFDTPLYLLGYMPQHNRIYLVDKSIAVVSYTLSLAVVEYQTAILRGDLPAAEALLPGIPREQRNRMARFLEARGLKELAFEVTQDDAHKFDLALGLDDLDGAHALALKLAPSDPANPEAVSVSPDTWRTLGDAALSVWRIELARDAYSRAGDLSALLLLLLSTGDRAGLADVATRAAKAGQNNLAFAALLQLGVEGRELATELLLGTGREPEAAMFARTYAPR
jgi:coatomer subunit beta'